MDTYLVGRNQTYTNIQDALDAAAAVLGGSPLVDTCEIVITDRGPYEPARVPVDFQPTSTYRLIIRTGTQDEGLWYERSSRAGETTKRAIISGGLNVDNAWTGLYVDQVDYVTIKNLEFTSLKAGIVYYQSDYGIVENCRLIDNDYFGVQLFQSNRGVIFNTAGSNSSILVSILRSKEAVLIHNSFVNSKNGKHAVWPEWHAELDGSILDNNVPLYYAYNNILVGKNAPPLAMPLDTEKTLSSMDGNIYWCATVNAIADLYQEINGKRYDTYVSGMTEWKRITGSDDNSSFRDPELFTVVVSGLYTAGLLLDETTTLAKAGVPLADIEGFPSWLSLSLFTTDSEGDPVGPSPTPGPTQILTGDDYDLFLDFLGATSDLTIESDGTIYGVDRSIRQLQKSVDPLFPKIAAGYFYVGDAAYYLYAKKMGQRLQNVSWSKVQLPAPMEVSNVYVEDTSSAEKVMHEVRWAKRGMTLWACHDDATLSKPVTEAIRVHATVPSWDSSQRGFVQTNTYYQFPIRTNPIEHYLPVPHKGQGPIVITDDTISGLSDRSIVPFEYMSDWNDELQMTHLHLQGSSNLLRNTHAHNSGMEWGASPSSELSYSDTSLTPPVGTRYQHSVLTANTTLFDQTLYRRDLEKDVVASWYSRSNNRGRFGVKVTTYLDDGSVYLETSSYYEALAESTGRWIRHALMLKADSESEFLEYGAPYDIYHGAMPIHTVDNKSSQKIRLQLLAVAPSTSDLTCMMASEGSYLTRYASLPYEDEMTIEFDSSDAGLYLVDDLSLSTIANPQHNGFITIGNVPANTLDDTIPEGHTILSDTYVPLRLSGLPWSKIDGPSKLRYVSGNDFSLESQGLPRETGLLPDSSVITSLSAFPSPLVVAQGYEKTFFVTALDQFRNPFAFEDITLEVYENNDRYPGLIGVRELGIPTKLGTTVTGKTDASGTFVATYIAPEKREIQTSFGTSEVLTDSIYSSYEVNETNFGNIRLTTVKNKASITLVGSEITAYLNPTVVGSNNRITLTSLPAFDTLRLQVAGTSDYDNTLNESLNASCGEEDFYVDYGTAQVFYNRKHTGQAKATYSPQLIYTFTSDPTKIVAPSLLSIMTSDIIMTYDAKAFIRITCRDQELTLPVIMQNPEI